MSFIAGVHTPTGHPLDADTVRLLFEAFDEQVGALAAQMIEVRTLLGLQPPAYEPGPAPDENLVAAIVERLAQVDLGDDVWVEETERYGAQVVHHLSDGGTITITVDHTPGDRPLDDEGDGA